MADEDFAPESFEDLNNDPDLTETSLREHLTAYQKALAEEFESRNKPGETPENVAEYTKDFFRKNVHSSAAQIVWLSNNAESESVSLAASKYVVEMATRIEENEKDPIKDLLNELKGNKKSPAPMED